MESNYVKEQSYIKAKKRVADIKSFYIHLIVYILVNIFISGIIVYGIMSSGGSFKYAITHFGTYSTALFWGIGLFFHWLGVFGFSSIGLGKNWEDKKIKQILEQDENRSKKINS